MKVRSLLLAVFCMLTLTSAAQQKFWISFTDKAGCEFDPYAYFDKAALDRRAVNCISLFDSSDFPVNEKYISEISRRALSVSWPSRWLNGVAAMLTDEQLEEIRHLNFVSAIEPMGFFGNQTDFRDSLKPLSKEYGRLLAYQTDRLQGNEFKKKSVNGKGIRIAVFDAGFPGVEKHPAFSKIRSEKRIIATYDFIGRSENVYKGHWHGTGTFSCIAGISDTTNIGLATGAEYLLARTEYAHREPFSEEENWLAASEWADKNGAKIISSSLGYTWRRYFSYQMDGHTSLVARAATMAAKKGILVVSSAGNDGDELWKLMDTPADADSVLAVGGTNPYSDTHIHFSSLGPTSDGRFKPNVCAPGIAIVAKKNGLSESYGTSFSAPLVAGFAACAWQTHPEWTNMELFDALEKSSSLYPYFDYAHGFGIPQASWFMNERTVAEPTFDFVIINDDIKVILRDKFSHAELEQDLGYTVKRNLFYKIEDRNSHIKSYTVLLASQKEMLHFLAGDFNPGDVITIHFEGYTSTLDFPEEN
jgi:serine protease AprX